MAPDGLEEGLRLHLRHVRDQQQVDVAVGALGALRRGSKDCRSFDACAKFGELRSQLPGQLAVLLKEQPEMGEGGVARGEGPKTPKDSLSLQQSPCGPTPEPVRCVARVDLCLARQLARPEVGRDCMELNTSSCEQGVSSSRTACRKSSRSGLS